MAPMRCTCGERLLPLAGRGVEGAVELAAALRNPSRAFSGRPACSKCAEGARVSEVPVES
jgi:hypothetical protein